MPRLKLFLKTFGIGLLVAVVLGGILYLIPPIRERVDWRIDALRTRIAYWLNPPGEAVFVPGQQSTQPPTAVPTATEPGIPTSTPTPTAEPLPEAVTLEGVQYEDQHNRWNYCGPANLSMALTFWGWEGNRDIVADHTKGNEQDKNIFPSEMVDFVQNHTTYNALTRVGGDLDLLMRFIAAGFPVLTEKGYYEFDYTGNYAWMGHYQYVTGYDQTGQFLIVQDTYIQEGENHEFGFDEFVEGWRAFNFVFVIVYPPEREAEVLDLLGPHADEQWAYAHALSLSESETEILSGVDEYFAWFNLGTNHVLQLEYIDGAHAYDKAFQLYAELPGTIRPYRMLWYQTGPYKAYYYSGRYQDVFELANTTLFLTISDPILEESFYWRGLAKEALDDLAGAIFDWQVCLELHPGWDDAIYELQRVGAWP
jgi:tetratricopeptide (TPR) repeat protein